MRSTDSSHEPRSMRGHRWWTLNRHREEPAAPDADAASEEEAVEGVEEGPRIPDEIPAEWVDNQTAHRVNR